MEKREPSYTVGENVNCIATIEKNMEIPLKTKNRATKRSSNLTPGHISGENHNWDTCTPIVHCITIYNSQDMEAT